MTDRIAPNALFHLFTSLPRQGPGSEASTREAFRRLPALQARPRVLDIGCGTGRQTLVLARDLEAHVLAVDIHEPYLAELTRLAAAAGLARAVETRAASMEALDLPEESFDLIWSEGAIYIVGVERALPLWRPLLRPSGCLAFTEVSWLTDTPPPEAAAFWQREYPQIDSVPANCRKAEAAGFQVVDTFALPSPDWWQDYYDPLRRRIETLRPEAAEWPELAAVIEGTEREIELFERFGNSYGYVFYLCQR